MEALWSAQLLRWFMCIHSWSIWLRMFQKPIHIWTLFENDRQRPKLNRYSWHDLIANRVVHILPDTTEIVLNPIYFTRRFVFPHTDLQQFRESVSTFIGWSWISNCSQIPKISFVLCFPLSRKDCKSSDLWYITRSFTPLSKRWDSNIDSHLECPISEIDWQWYNGYPLLISNQNRAAR